MFASARSFVVFAALVLAGCENERPRRVTHEFAGETEPDANALGIDDASWTPPRDPDPTVTLSPAVDDGASVCVGMRILRVDRHRDAGALPPRHYGRDEYGRIVPFESVLRCELRQMHWVEKPRMEGMNLILWRGPEIFAPDGECEWREPFTTARLPDGSRRMTLHEHCRHRPSPGPADRIVTVEVRPDYSAITAR